MLARYPSTVIVYILTALMISTCLLYLINASQDNSELSLSSRSAGEHQDASDIVKTRNEMTFFIIVAVAYVVVGICIAITKYRHKIPYIISIIGSLALIAFYIATRTINIPYIGLQDDIGTLDIVTKLLQAAIVAISIYLLIKITRNRHQGAILNK
jgi:quinol-cytochrome oxidoreductase complex cytochrome b subunit